MRLFPIIFALVLLLVGGLFHGLLTDRWFKPESLQKALDRVAQVPLDIGPWKGKEIEGEEDSFAHAGAQAYWTRQYTHPRKKITLLVILMCGRPGRMGVHTPEVCYRGAGYDMMQSAPLLWKVSQSHAKNPAEFWTARFTKETELGSDLRLYWAWNAGQGWQAPARPRRQYWAESFLYKLYISQETLASASGPGDPPLVDFMGHFLPVLEKTLFL